MSNSETVKDLSPEYAELLFDLISEVMVKLVPADLLKQAIGVDITTSQVHALRFIYRHGNECSVTELAEGLYITLPAGTKLVDRLEKHKWVTRRVDDKDHRISHVRLTDFGEALIEKVKSLRTERIHQILEEMELQTRQDLWKGLESFIRKSFPDDKDLESLCQHCGSEAFDYCVINKSVSHTLSEHTDIVCS